MIRKNNLTEFFFECNMKTVFKFNLTESGNESGLRISDITIGDKYMEEKIKYSTKQQKVIMECLQEYGDTFYTIDQFMERLQKEGAVLKVPSVEGAPAQYRFIRDEERKNYGKLVCLECGHTIPLQCGCIDHFVGHVLDEHGFEIDQSRTIFYGYCDKCRRKRK